MGLCLLLPSQGATSSLLLSPFSPSPLALLSSPRPLIFLSHSYSDYISPWLLFLSVFLFLVYRILPRAATATLSPNISFCQETFLPPPPRPFLFPLFTSFFTLITPTLLSSFLFLSRSISCFSFSIYAQTFLCSILLPLVSLSIPFDSPRSQPFPVHASPVLTFLSRFTSYSPSPLISLRAPSPNLPLLYTTFPLVSYSPAPSYHFPPLSCFTFSSSSTSRAPSLLLPSQSSQKRKHSASCVPSLAHKNICSRGHCTWSPAGCEARAGEKKKRVKVKARNGRGKARVSCSNGTLPSSSLAPCASAISFLCSSELDTK